MEPEKSSSQLKQPPLEKLPKKSSQLKQPPLEKLPKKRTERSYRRWTQDQNLIYAKFLSEEKHNFISKWQRKSSRVFMRLSKLLKTKNNTQCKTHHQKMEQSYGSVEGIIKKFLPTRQVVEDKKSYDQDMEQSYRSVDGLIRKALFVETPRQVAEDIFQPASLIYNERNQKSLHTNMKKYGERTSRQILKNILGTDEVASPIYGKGKESQKQKSPPQNLKKASLRTPGPAQEDIPGTEKLDSLTHHEGNQKSHNQEMEDNYGPVKSIIRNFLPPETPRQVEKNIPGMDKVASPIQGKGKESQKQKSPPENLKKASLRISGQVQEDIPEMDEPDSLVAHEEVENQVQTQPIQPSLRDFTLKSIWQDQIFNVLTLN